MYYGQKYDLGNGIFLIFALRVEIGKEHRYFQEWIPPKGTRFALKNSVLVRTSENNHKNRIVVTDGLGQLKPTSSQNGTQAFHSPDRLNVVVEDSQKKITFIGSWIKEEDGTRKLHVEKSEQIFREEKPDNLTPQKREDHRSQKNSRKFNPQDPTEKRVERRNLAQAKLQKIHQGNNGRFLGTLGSRKGGYKYKFLNHKFLNH
jgi:hypothetical protein